MKQFKIYSNPQGSYEAVKQGWSWPAFFFSCIWALVKKMWVLGVGVFALLFLLGVIAGVVGEDDEEAIITIADVAGLIVSIVFGVSGNSWRERNLESRGYDCQGAVNASNPEGALALYIKENPAEQWRR